MKAKRQEIDMVQIEMDVREVYDLKTLLGCTRESEVREMLANSMTKLKPEDVRRIPEYFIKILDKPVKTLESGGSSPGRPTNHRSLI